MNLSELVKTLLRQYFQEKEESFFQENSDRFLKNQVFSYYFSLIYNIIIKKLIERLYFIIYTA